jgi:hypothetical protein
MLFIEITTRDINAVKCMLMGLNNELKTLKWGSIGLGVYKLDVKQSKNLNQEISHEDFAVVATPACLQIT